MILTEQQALGLREIGYDLKCEHFELVPYGKPFSGYEKLYYPDIDKAIRWLREVKGVHVAASTNEQHSGWICNLQVKGQYEPISVIDEDCPSKYHDLAQSAGLDAAIEYVKKEQL